MDVSLRHASRSRGTQREMRSCRAGLWVLHGPETAKRALSRRDPPSPTPRGGPARLGTNAGGASLTRADTGPAGRRTGERGAGSEGRPRPGAGYLPARRGRRAGSTAAGRGSRPPAAPPATWRGPGRRAGRPGAAPALRAPGSATGLAGWACPLGRTQDAVGPRGARRWRGRRAGPWAARSPARTPRGRLCLEGNGPSPPLCWARHR